LVALKNVLEVYPLTNDRVEIEYLILSSYYKLAQKSIQSLKKERFGDVTAYYLEVKSDLEGSKYASSSENLYNNSLNQLKK